MKRLIGRTRLAGLPIGALVLGLSLSSKAAFAGTSGKIDTGDTAWVLASAALVMLMTPGLGLFYAGMVRRKNVLGTILQSFMMVGVVGVLWVLYGYSLSLRTRSLGPYRFAAVGLP